jgi:hypothetical protein
MRTGSRFSTFLAFVILLSISTVNDAGGAESDAAKWSAVEQFIQTAPVSDAERKILSETVQFALSETEWVISSGEMTYVLVVRPIQKSERPAVQARLEEMARGEAKLRGYRRLCLLTIIPERKARYASEEALAEVLSLLDERREKREGKALLRPDIAISAFSKEWAFSLTRIRESLLRVSREATNAVDEISLAKAYCGLRISLAKSLFGKIRYEAALPIYKEVRALGEGGPTDCLDMSECFLRTNDKENAVQAVVETVADYGDVMDSFAMERAADICFDSDEEGLAEEYYLLATRKLRTEGRDWFFGEILREMQWVKTD